MLEEFSLTPTEENVYLTLLKLGSSPAADIIKKTQLHRTTVYDVLNRLIEKGLVNFITKNKKKYYSAVSPSKFFDIASEEKQKAEEKQKLAKEIIKEINLIKTEHKAENIAQIFMGEQGQRTFMKDIIDIGEDFFVFGSAGSAKESLPLYIEQWAEQRKKKNIKAKILATERTRAPIWKLNQIKYLPKGYQSPTVTTIYGDKIAIFIDEIPPLIIIIESQKVAQSYKNYFDLLWKIAKD